MMIATDADGVLTDMSGFNYTYGEKFFGHPPTAPDGYTTAEIFGETKARELLFGVRYFYDYCCRLEPRRNALAVCAKLASEGHGICAITARKFSTMNNPLGALSRSMFGKWCEKNELNFDDVFFCTEKNTPAEKLEHCRKINAEIMIDDKPDIALHLAQNGIRVLLFDAPYNRSVAHVSITRVRSWDEIYEYVSGLGKYQTMCGNESPLDNPHSLML